MPPDEYDKHAARIVASIYKATLIPQLLPYLRKQLIADITYNIDHLTEEEIETYVELLKQANS
jgi:hypothetical protein